MISSDVIEGQKTASIKAAAQFIEKTEAAKKIYEDLIESGGAAAGADNKPIKEKKIIMMEYLKLRKEALQKLKENQMKRV